MVSNIDVMGLTDTHRVFRRGIAGNSGQSCRFYRNARIEFEMDLCDTFGHGASANVPKTDKQNIHLLFLQMFYLLVNRMSIKFCDKAVCRVVQLREKVEIRLLLCV